MVSARSGRLVTASMRTGALVVGILRASARRMRDRPGAHRPGCARSGERRGPAHQRRGVPGAGAAARIHRGLGRRAAHRAHRRIRPALLGPAPGLRCHRVPATRGGPEPGRRSRRLHRGGDAGTRPGTAPDRRAVADVRQRREPVRLLHRERHLRPGRPDRRPRRQRGAMRHLATDPAQRVRHRRSPLARHHRQSDRHRDGRRSARRRHPLRPGAADVTRRGCRRPCRRRR